MLLCRAPPSDWRCNVICMVFSLLVASGIGQWHRPRHRPRHAVNKVGVQASAVKATITPVAAEAGARAVSELSASRAWKAVQLHVLDKGEQPCFKSTIPLLAKALSKAEDNEGFNGLLEAVEPHLLSVCAEKTEYSIEEQHECMRCMNVMLRMQGKLNVDGAVEKLNRYGRSSECAGLCIVCASTQTAVVDRQTHVYRNCDLPILFLLALLRLGRGSVPSAAGDVISTVQVGHLRMTAALQIS